MHLHQQKSRVKVIFLEPNDEPAGTKKTLPVVISMENSPCLT
jgi:hypothetical protein